MRISVVVPCRNEATHLEAVVRSIPKIVEEIVIVDNLSTDTTLQVARQIAKKDKRVTVLSERRESRGVGYGYACITGMQKSTGDYVVCLDGDGSYPTHMIEQMVRFACDNHIDVLLGNRYSHNGPYKLPAYLRMGTRMLSRMASILYGYVFQDVVSGMWVVRREVLQILQLDEGGWDLSLQIKINALCVAGISLDVYPIGQHRRLGRSKQKYFRTGARHVVWLIRHRNRVNHQP